MSEATRVRGVIVGHGDMARGLVDAVRRIAGEQASGLEAVTNEGKGPDALRKDVDSAAGEGPAIVFVDLQTGSCGAAAAYACRGSGHPRAVICGVNLPMLLDFVFHRELALNALVTRLVENGRAAIRAVPSAS
jgi:mannose/fructose-specific phosphotransferase system component IIA